MFLVQLVIKMNFYENQTKKVSVLKSELYW